LVQIGGGGGQKEDLRRVGDKGREIIEKPGLPRSRSSRALPRGGSWKKNKGGGADE